MSPAEPWPVIDFSGLYRAYAREIHRFATLLSGDPALCHVVVRRRLRVSGL